MSEPRATSAAPWWWGLIPAHLLQGTWWASALEDPLVGKSMTFGVLAMTPDTAAEWSVLRKRHADEWCP